MRLPRGDLLRSRVVDSPAEPLRDALDRGLTGYLRFEPGDALLLDDETAGVVTVEDGVPVLAYEAASDRGGPAALDAVAAPGPYRAELYAVPAGSLADVHESADSDLTVPPSMPADRLAGDAALAERTREAAPDGRLEDDESSLEAFLADEERVDAIRRRAREEARARAEEWGLTDQLDRATAAGSSGHDADAPTDTPPSDAADTAPPDTTPSDADDTPGSSGVDAPALGTDSESPDGSDDDRRP
ncbi:MAG: hypothetical protein ABEH47_06190 [Haloferacaceae archaeon]